MRWRWMLVMMCWAVLAVGGAAAQTADSTLLLRPSHQLGFDFRAGYVPPGHRFFKGENRAGERINTSLSMHLKYAFRFGRDTYYGRFYPHAYQGIGLAYQTFFSPDELGSPVLLYVFQGSRIARLSPRLTLDYEWNFGASFGWKKYDEESNPWNKVVGSRTNAYMNLAFLLNWQLSPSWQLTAGLDLTHYSNGNTYYPNYGVNAIGGRLGVVHTLYAEDEKEDRHATDALVAGRYAPFQPNFSYDLLVYGATRCKGFIDDEGHTHILEGNYGIVGLNFAPMYHFNKYFRAGVSLDAQFDESANLKYYMAGEDAEGEEQFYRPPFSEQFTVGLSARAELVMPIFSVNAGIGYNIYQRGEDGEGLYQVLALKASVTRHLFLHVGYQLYRFHQPNNLMLGIGVRFGAK